MLILVKKKQHYTQQRLKLVCLNISDRWPTMRQQVRDLALPSLQFWRDFACVAELCLERPSDLTTRTPGCTQICVAPHVSPLAFTMWSIERQNPSELQIAASSGGEKTVWDESPPVPGFAELLVEWPVRVLALRATVPAPTAAECCRCLATGRCAQPSAMISLS